VPLGMQGGKSSLPVVEMSKSTDATLAFLCWQSWRVVENMDSQPNTARTTLLFKAIFQILQSVSRKDMKGWTQASFIETVKQGMGCWNLPAYLQICTKSRRSCNEGNPTKFSDWLCFENYESLFAGRCSSHLATSALSAFSAAGLSKASNPS
jgi:hypothetical protein